MSSDDWESASSPQVTLVCLLWFVTAYLYGWRGPWKLALYLLNVDAEGLALIILCFNLIGTVTKNNLFQGLKIAQRSLSQCCHSLFEGLGSLESIAIYLVLLLSQTKRILEFISRRVKAMTTGVSLCCLIQAVLNEGFLWEDKKPRKPDACPKEVYCVDGNTWKISTELFSFLYFLTHRKQSQIPTQN